MHVREVISEAKDYFAGLILWGKADFRDDIKMSRYTRFERLVSTLKQIQPHLADQAAAEHLEKTFHLVSEAEQFYKAGNFRGGMLTIQEAHEAFLEVRAKSPRGKIVNVPLL